MKVPGSTDRPPIELKMTPMIDVVFLLLVFFVWTSSFEIPEFDLPGSIAMPPTGTLAVTDQPPPEAFDEIVIRLSRNNDQLVIRANGEVIMNTSVLRDYLARVLEVGVQPPVIVDPDDNVTMQWAVEVYDAARSVGVDRVLFAAAPG